MDGFGFKYLSVIKECMDQVYREIPNLINQRGREIGHEQSISFRLGYYLSNALKDKMGYYIDLEYNNDYGKKGDEKYNSEGKKVRPDIIFHDRKKNNLFVIEMKKGDVSDDREKVWNYMQKNTQHYKEGYCIYHLKEYPYIIEAFKRNEEDDDIEKKIFECNKDGCIKNRHR